MPSPETPGAAHMNSGLFTEGYHLPQITALCPAWTIRNMNIPLWRRSPRPAGRKRPWRTSRRWAVAARAGRRLWRPVFRLLSPRSRRSPRGGGRLSRLRGGTHRRGCERAGLLSADNRVEVRAEADLVNPEPNERRGVVARDRQPRPRAQSPDQCRGARHLGQRLRSERPGQGGGQLVRRDVQRTRRVGYGRAGQGPQGWLVDRPSLSAHPDVAGRSPAGGRVSQRAVGP